MEDSILKGTKKILGLQDDYTAFDHDIITHINATLATVTQIGIPVSVLPISGAEPKWADLDLPEDQLSMIKTYVFLKVRMLFDPPPTSFHLQAMKDQVAEFESRLSYLRESANS